MYTQRCERHNKTLQCVGLTYDSPYDSISPVRDLTQFGTRHCTFFGLRCLHDNGRLRMGIVRLIGKQDVLPFLRMFWPKHPDLFKNLIWPD